MASAGRCAVRSSGSWSGGRSGRRCWCAGGCVGCWRCHRRGRGLPSAGRGVRPCGVRCAGRVRTARGGGGSVRRRGRCGPRGREGGEAAGAGRAGADVAGDVARDLFLAYGVLQGGFEHGVDVGERERGEVLTAALADGAAARSAAGRGVGLAAGVDAACAALADGPQSVQPGAHVLGSELGELLLAEAGNEVLVDTGGCSGCGWSRGAGGRRRSPASTSGRRPGCPGQ
jgi:hypothetical protein